MKKFSNWSTIGLKNGYDTADWHEEEDYLLKLDTIKDINME